MLHESQRFRAGLEFGAAILSGIPTAIIAEPCPGATENCQIERMAMGTAIGFVSLHTLELRLACLKPLCALVETAVGLALFEKAIPDPDATKLNIALTFGFSLHAALSRRLHLLGSFNWLHLSDGGLGAVNPALDARLLVFGLSIADEKP